jgi:hypothetical protein
MQMQDRQGHHIRQRKYLPVSPEVRGVAHCVSRQFLHRMFDRVADYPRGQTGVVCVDLVVELRDHGVRGVLDAEGQVDNAAEEDGEPELVVVPAGV